MVKIRDIDGWIIAGGSAARMGIDKAALEFGESRLIELAARALSSVAGERISIAGANRDFAPQYPAFPDSDEADPGPMAGLRSALEYGTSDWIAVIACDMPFVTGNVFSKLADEIEDVDAVVPLQPDGRPQPLCALYRRRSVLKAVIERPVGRDRSLRVLLGDMDTRYIAFDAFREMENAENLFLNVNSPGDLARAKEIFDKMDRS